MLQDIIRARPLLWMLIKRELRTRYAGSILGGFWNLIHPVVLILIYIIVFSRVMGSRMGVEDGQGRFAYAIHLCAGFIPWILFSEIITRCSNILMENSNLLKKMSIPEEILFLSIFFTSLMVHFVSMIALIFLLTIMGADVSPLVLFAFPVMTLLAVTGLGIGMMLSVMTLLVRDVGQFVQIGLQLMFWSLPIVYLPSILGEGTISAIMRLNPLRGFFTLTQLLFNSPEAAFHSDAYWVMALLPFAAVLIGANFLRSHRSEILDTL